MSEHAQAESPPAPMALPEAGSIAQWPVPRLLHLVRATRYSGVLELQREGVEKLVHFVDGRPTWVDSRLITETLGAWLVANKVITEETHRRSLELMRESGRKQGEALLQLGALRPHELYEALYAHIRAKLISCFAWEDGGFAQREGRLVTDAVLSLRIEVPRLILDGLERHWSSERIEAALTLPAGSRVVAAPPGGYELDELKLSTTERRAYTYLLSGKPVNRLLREASAREEVLRLLYATLEMELVRFTAVPRPDVPEASTGGRPSARTSRQPAPPRPERVERQPEPVEAVEAPEPVEAEVEAPIESVEPESPIADEPPAAVAREETPEAVLQSTDPVEVDAELLRRRDDFLAEYMRMMELDYVTLLDVSLDPSAKEVVQAYDALMVRLDPGSLTDLDGPEGAGLPPMSDKVRALLERIATARDTLGDPEQRVQYLSELSAAHADSWADRQKVRDTMLEGTRAFDDGLRALRRERFSDAVQHFKAAIHHNLNEPSYYAHLSYAVYRVFRDRSDLPREKARKEAIEQVNTALALQPDLDCAHYYKGKILQEEGELEKALACYREALRLNPGYDAAAEQLREVDALVGGLPRKKRRRGFPFFGRRRND